MTRTAPSASTVSAALARDRLGVSAVVFFVMSGVAALTVAAGVVTTAYAVTGLTAIPAAFIAVAVVLGLFSVGYVAMSRHITNAGAFYAFVARGLGRPAGVVAALVALLAYNLLQVGLYGALGPGAASYAADKFNVHAPWWAWALGAWAVVAILGVLRVDLNGRVLAVLLSAEILVVIALTVAGLLRPARGQVSFATLAPTTLLASGIGAAPRRSAGVTGSRSSRPWWRVRRSSHQSAAATRQPHLCHAAPLPGNPNRPRYGVCGGHELQGGDHVVPQVHRHRPRNPRRQLPLGLG